MKYALIWLLGAFTGGSLIVLQTTPAGVGGDFTVHDGAVVIFVCCIVIGLTLAGAYCYYFEEQ